jgi:hypothetical protein
MSQAGGQVTKASALLSKAVGALNQQIAQGKLSRATLKDVAMWAHLAGDLVESVTRGEAA